MSGLVACLVIKAGDRLVQGFLWLKEQGNAAGKKTGIEALATALSLAAKDGSGWDTLTECAADETAPRAGSRFLARFACLAT
jgi:hypothetical protein